MSTQIDHLVVAEDRLATQFKEADVFISYIKALLYEANSIEQVMQDILRTLWIDEAVGAQLDIIGVIVGQRREVIDSSIIEYFGFAGNPQSNSFGTLDDAGIGGRFISLEESSTGNRQLTDSEYRDFIKARIIKNGITPTIPAMTAFFQTFFMTDNIIIEDLSSGPMTYKVKVGRPLTLNEQVFLANTTLVPKVACASVTYEEYTP